MIRRSIWNWIGALVLILGVTGIQQVLSGQETQPSQEATSKKKSKKKKKAEDEGTSSSANRAQQPPESTDSKAVPTAEQQSGKATRPAPQPVKNASDADIAAAQASGKVWVNTDTGVYHKSGRWYGATRKGKFMTEDEAKHAGYRDSKQ
jgi:cytoskeletal protein RodZ